MSRKRARAETPRPKRGPGQEFVAEFVDAASGHARRFRNVNCTPLSAAFHRGALNTPADSCSRVTADDRLAAGEIFERLWFTFMRSGTDSTERMPGRGSGMFFTETKQHAGIRLTMISSTMATTNFRIVKAFCGEQLELSAALRSAGVDAHPDGRAYRLREALDDLVRAVSGWREAKKVA